MLALQLPTRATANRIEKAIDTDLKDLEMITPQYTAVSVRVYDGGSDGGGDCDGVFGVMAATVTNSTNNTESMLDWM